MTQEDKRVKIAEACGFSEVEPSTDGRKRWRRAPDPEERAVRSVVGIENLPDYFNDLNAMHEAEKVLKGSKDDEHSEISEYQGQLIRICACSQDPVDVYEVDLIRSTAAQRAEAFGITLELWKGGE